MQQKLKTSTLDQLKKRFTPTSVIRFTNTEDKTDYIDFVVRRLGSNPLGFVNGNEILTSLTRIQRFAALGNDIEKMTPEELSEFKALDTSTLVSDLQNMDEYRSVVVSRTVISPKIPNSEVLHTLPDSWIGVIVEYTMGGLQPEPDAIEGFTVEVLPYTGSGTETSPISAEE